MMKVLFVDDEPQLLRGIERMLDAAEVDWEVLTADSGQTALNILADEDIQTIVTDMRMPGMDGSELLAEVSRQFPHVVRVVLSGQADRKSVFRAVQPMHQYLAKPCDAQTLTATISRAHALSNVLNSVELHRLISGLESLPSLPVVYQKLMDALEDETVSLECIGQIISQDPAMTAKILQIVNSAMFGLRNPVSSPDKAASFLGVEIIKSLALSVGVFRQFEDQSTGKYSIDQLMHHSLVVGTVSRSIAIQQGMNRTFQNEAFTIGLLHDIGKLILLSVDREKFGRAADISRGENRTMWEAELELFGATHAAAGAHLLNIWGLPQHVIEVVALHHNPGVSDDHEFSLTTAVTAANYIVNENNNLTFKPCSNFTEFLEKMNLVSQLPAWRELYLSQTSEEAE